MIFALGFTAGLLLASLTCNFVQFRRARGMVAAALQHEQRLLDRAHAAELRAAEQIDAMLDRISTVPRLEVRPTAGPAVDTETKKYIADTPYMDEVWEKHVGATEDEVE